MDRKFAAAMPIWACLYFGWVVLLVWLSLTSLSSPWRVDFAFEDKINHALAYALLAFLGERTWRHLPPVRRPWLWSLLVALGFGAGMEVAQMTLTRVRTAEWGDWLADGMGAGLALVLIAYWNKKRRQAS